MNEGCNDTVTYWFIEPLVVNDELFVLLPGSDEIIRNGMEYLTIDLGLSAPSATDYGQLMGVRTL